MIHTTIKIGKLKWEFSNKFFLRILSEGMMALTTQNYKKALD